MWGLKSLYEAVLGRRDIGGNTENSTFVQNPPSAPDLAPGNFAHAALPPGMNWRLTRDLPDSLYTAERVAWSPIYKTNSVPDVVKGVQWATIAALTAMIVGFLMTIAVMCALGRIRRRWRATRAEVPLLKDVEMGEDGHVVNGDVMPAYKSAY